MRRFNNYRKALLSLAVVGMLAAGCDDNDEIAVDPGTEYDVELDVPSETNEDVIVDANTQSTINAKVSFTSADKSMKRLYITVNKGGQGEEAYEPVEDVDLKSDGAVDLTGKNDKDFEFAFKLPVYSGIVGTVVYKFWTTTGNGDIRDINQRLAVGPGTITLKYGAGVNGEADVKSFNNIELRAPLADGTSKTFVSVANGQSYKISDGVEFVTFWDFGYLYLTEDHASLSSPFSYNPIVVNIPDKAKTTEELNKFYFKESSKTSADFEAIETKSDLNTAVSATTSSPQTIGNLSEGQVVEFVDQYGKKGLIRVESITAGNGTAGFIVLDIKVQP